MLKCDAVFQGGGVKGIGLVGAVKAIEKKYNFVNLVGNSAGAIVASLLAVGYSGEEIEHELKNLNYLKFKDETLIDKMGIPGKILSTVLEYGIYEGNYFRNWIEELFKAKGKTTFGDIRMNDSTDEKYSYKFSAIASDLTEKKMIVIPQDLKYFGFDPDKFSISLAVRMSMSIPLYFEPVKLQDTTGKTHYIVDGGVLSNYPIWLLDDGSNNPKWPTIGFKFFENTREVQQSNKDHSISSILEYCEDLVDTMLNAHDKHYISTIKGDFDRTIMIPTEINIDGKNKKINTTYFDITQEESNALLLNGYNAAEKFLETWDFDLWKEKFRS
ncbi:NTE family protein [Clostridium saccharoperbutylacetonicum]|jgi:NTE family protein|uniref:Putative esterase of the alpha-beta hydrolase superfamily n=1 Tax=Clostridium saccharoperbutylacetonicum N1-4(HMT) TaxID=931276 RepID=M1MR82_9CLOT|nr:MULTISPECIES: patatin-like phospholipase family protein [Clostridium]AGF54117.1 putative esterase of the alpha-beta hydrolase superfamily [Clostridium saccharoperbutylacetonicum N1-4(HMT)]NRT59369.1 NTE family protein [Clostridium saccharoperbutylacetonicum]NSB28560.1 NTE family protein [Clostridium saccharoperbutylacetonicum]NSB42052.1 NTE family protein [Clostridium saccharoperbutylacetonicum]